MNESTQRSAVRLALVGIAIGVGLLMFLPAAGAQFLEGTFWVACTKCKRCDKVEALTRNHTCETNRCGNRTVSGGTAYLVCPSGHWRDNRVQNITRQHQCQKKVGKGICGKQCRGPFPRPTPEK